MNQITERRRDPLPRDLPEVAATPVNAPPDAEALRQIVVVGGGAAGLELATRLGDRLGRRGLARIILVDCARTPLWKPELHSRGAGRASCWSIVHERICGSRCCTPSRRVASIPVSTR